MARELKKYFNRNEYLHRIKKIRRNVKSRQLLKRQNFSAQFVPLWTNINPSVSEVSTRPFKINIFGHLIDPNEVNWHKDYPGDFVFPLIRMDRIKLSEFTNRGIDIKFPWELSRFGFANELAVSYVTTGDNSYYERFRELVVNWDCNNPFMTGINWLCTMDVGIRAINWIIAANAFSDLILDDPEFHLQFSRSLVEHAVYIDAFPEIYSGNHTTNHTVADFVGLLFLSRALPDHPESSAWEKRAIKWLIRCMDYQVYHDGGSFEASSGYHRLVTELFGITALLCGNHGIELPDGFHQRLQSMFHFISAITDQHGHAPGFGDNDSSTLLQYEFDRNGDFSYLSDFFNLIYDKTHIKEAAYLNTPALMLFPGAELLPVIPGPELDKGESRSLSFPESGVYVLKKKHLTGIFYCLPLGLNGQGGHNHCDVGSFTLSHNGQPLIVDPGSFTYTRDFELRNRFRSYRYHNTVIPDELGTNDFIGDNLFMLDEYYQMHNCAVKEDQKVTFMYQLNGTHNPITRIFQLSNKSLEIEDRAAGTFLSKIHLAPSVNIIEAGVDIIRTEQFVVKLDQKQSYNIESYEYSVTYGRSEISKVLCVKACEASRIKIQI